ncbi:hypothetical protein A2U01_0078964, partial [Trifolium medium]|nr:hypothetical protein [Trifolium medium]
RIARESSNTSSPTALLVKSQTSEDSSSSATPTVNSVRGFTNNNPNRGHNNRGRNNRGNRGRNSDRGGGGGRGG